METIKYYNLPDVHASLVIGRAGTGKTAGYVCPIINELQSESLVVIDNRNYLSKKFSKDLKEKGYIIKLLNIQDVNKSDKYNPFKYIYNESDIEVLADSFIASTKEPNEDRFYIANEKAFLRAVIGYVYAECPNPAFNDVIKMCNLAGSNFEEFKNRFEELRDNADNIAKQAVMDFKNTCTNCMGKTLSSVIVGLMTKLSIFNVPKINSLISDDTIDMETVFMSGKKTAIFINYPVYDNTYTVIANMFISQLIHTGYEMTHMQKVRLILDDFPTLNLSKNCITELYKVCIDNNFRTDILIQSIDQLENKLPFIISHTIVYMGGVYSESDIQICKDISKDCEKKLKSLTSEDVLVVNQLNNKVYTAEKVYIY